MYFCTAATNQLGHFDTIHHQFYAVYLTGIDRTGFLFPRRYKDGFHVTSQQPNRANHTIHTHHVGSFFALSGIGKSHKICSHSLLLNLHKAKLHRSNNVINIYSLIASLTCSNKISKKLKHILLFFLGFSYTAPRKIISNMVLARSAYRVVKRGFSRRGTHFVPTPCWIFFCVARCRKRACQTCGKWINIYDYVGGVQFDFMKIKQ